jgi:RNA polymerase sigma-B factor
MFLRRAACTDNDPERALLTQKLITEHLQLARNLAARFTNRGEPLDDLVQVARVGLVKAVERYDPSRGVEFIAFAVPTITGELRRYFRDSGWDVRVPRRLQELNIRIRGAVDELSQRTGRAPTAGELAEYLQVSREDVVEGLQAANAYTSTSLDLPAGPDSDALTLGDTLGSLDTGLEAVENHEALMPLLAALPERERRILHLRFVEELTQTQIAQEIGVSQMHVSRLLATTLARLRTQLLSD